MKLTNDSIKLYIGRYKNDIIAVSEDKDFILEYMEKNRLFKRSEYTVDKTTVDSAYMYTLYGDKIISEFYGLMIPKIDQYIIEQDYCDMDSDIDNLINKLNYYAFITNRDKKTREYTPSIIKTIKAFTDITESDKKKNALLKNHMLGHPVIKCTIDEYYKMLHRYEEYNALSERYKYLCHKDE